MHYIIKHDAFYFSSKILCFLISILLVLSFTGCGIIIDISKEEKAYQATIDSLIDALDNKDADAICKLFSPYVREQDNDLPEQTDKLLSVYDGPADEVGRDGLLAGEASYESGDVSKSSNTTFPIRCGDTYYWCYLKLMYVNTFDESQIGITQLDFYTADEYCVFWYDDDATTVDSLGLEVYAEKTTEDEIHCIRGKPSKFSSVTKELDLDDIKSFFISNQSFSDFKARFGEPNAENIYTYYSLPQENGKKRYLELCIDGDIIYSADIVDDFKYIEAVFSKNE